MSADMISEDQLRAALQPHRVDAELFERQVHALLEVSVNQPEDRYAKLPVLLRGAAAFLPPLLFGGGKAMASTAPVAPVSGFAKVLGFVAFPAISLVVLLGITLFSVFKIRSIQKQNDPTLLTDDERREGMKKWWYAHRWGFVAVYGIAFALVLLNATWLVFSACIFSLLILLWVLRSLAKVGLGTRQGVGPACANGLIFLASFAGMPGPGYEGIHLFDQHHLSTLFFCGAWFIIMLQAISLISAIPVNWIAKAILRALSVAGCVFACSFTTSWNVRSQLSPVTPATLKSYVESFDKAEFSSSSWNQWEIPATWAVESGMNPDLAKPRKLFAAEMAGKQNPFILGTAFRTGLIQIEQLHELREYEKQLKALLDDDRNFYLNRPLLSLEQYDWLIRAAVLRSDLTEDRRDYLAKRLHATLAAEPKREIYTLNTSLLATQLLEVIGRKVDPAQYRAQIHEMLLKFHCKVGGGFQLAGGFKVYSSDNIKVGALEATSHAVQLMEIYGIPNDLDVNWVRSYLRPLDFRPSPTEFMAAATLERLNRIPGVPQMTWYEMIYYERTFIAAVILVALCIYATWSAPVPVREPPKGHVDAEHSKDR